MGEEKFETNSRAYKTSVTCWGRMTAIVVSSSRAGALRRILTSGVVIALCFGLLFLCWNMVKLLPAKISLKEKFKQQHSTFNNTRWAQNLSYFLPPPNHLCLSSPDFVLVIFSAVKNFKERQSIRRTWGGIDRVHNVPGQNRTVTIARAFVLGRQDLLQFKVRQEYQFYHDIIQGDYTDSYKNISYKCAFAFKFVSEVCSSSQFLVKADDDVFLNTYNLAKIAPYNTNNAIMGLVLRGKDTGVVRGNSKSAVSKEDYPEDHYPPYVSGMTFLVTMDAVIKLYRAVTTAKFHVIDDVLFTGILRVPLNISLIDVIIYIDGGMSFKLARACKAPGYLSFHDVHPAQQFQIWKHVQTRRNPNMPCYWRNEFNSLLYQALMA